jgi:hypothetical protein
MNSECALTLAHEAERKDGAAPPPRLSPARLRCLAFLQGAPDAKNAYLAEAAPAVKEKCSSASEGF